MRSVLFSDQRGASPASSDHRAVRQEESPADPAEIRAPASVRHRRDAPAAGEHRSQQVVIYTPERLAGRQELFTQLRDKELTNAGSWMNLPTCQAYSRWSKAGRHR